LHCDYREKPDEKRKFHAAQHHPATLKNIFTFYAVEVFIGSLRLKPLILVLGIPEYKSEVGMIHEISCGASALAEATSR
jgi:hypothetical protein